MRTTPRTMIMPVIATVAALALSCADRPLVEVEPVVESYLTTTLQQTEMPRVDILVVVDNSRSMREEQENLAEEFPGLIRALLDPPPPGPGEDEQLPLEDLHIGVISTDMGTGGYSVDTCSDPIDGDDGVLRHDPAPGMPGCEVAYPTYLSYDQTTVDTALVDKMAQDFGCIAQLGTGGCGFEQQLEAAVRALEHSHSGGPNAGFLREDSLLLVLFVTDEEDCSVKKDPESQTIFDQNDTTQPCINLRCFMQPHKVQPVSVFEDAFRAVRPDPNKLLFGFIVGVPPESICEGPGSELGGCLEMAEMQEVVDTSASCQLVTSCKTDDGEAFPPRRFIDLAQRFGDQSYVRSICTEDFGPAISGLTSKLRQKIEILITQRELDVDKDPLDACRCVATCDFVEELVDSRDCPPGRPCYEPDGPGTGCAYTEDDTGMLRTLCVIPQAGTRLSACDLTCVDPAAEHAPDGEGWYYDPYGNDGHPFIGFTESAVPLEGSTVYIQCESHICPENRSCGPDGAETSICCDDDHYCDRTGASPTCLPRPD